MKTRETIFDGIPIVVPVINGELLNIPYRGYQDIPGCCGAGRGIGNVIVPERILFLRVSLACLIHDKMWEIADYTWADFHLSNSIFLHNLLSIIKHKSNNTVIEHLRNYRAVTYYNAVDTIGVKIFWA